MVHRNHFADVEENRGIALRPLLTELAAELRVSAPERRAELIVDLDLDTVNTTQDVAVAVAFLVTEIVEFAMLRAPEEPIEIALRRTSELTARLTLGSPVLTGDEADDPEQVAVRADRRRPGQAAPLDARAQARPVQRRVSGFPAELTENRDRFGLVQKKLRDSGTKSERTGVEYVRIVTYCPPALAIRLNGPETANPLPPGGAFGPLFLSGADPRRILTLVCLIAGRA